VELARGQHVAAQRVDQRRQQAARFAYPVGQRGAIEVDADALIDFRLAIERKMIRVMFCRT
jgi:hypothetical protein